MPTSAYWADVKVEVAFNAGFSTAAASRVWTDISDCVEADQGITINFGRQDERSQADANTLSLTLDNRDGRFTPNRAAGAYYPNVKLYRPIRVTATPPGGAASVRFVGYVTSWNNGWPDGTDAAAFVEVSASSRLQRLGITDQRRSVIEETYLLDSPSGYWPLGEASGVTSAADVSGRGMPPMTMVGSGDPVVFGSATGPPTDGLTAVQFAAGKYLASSFTPLAVGTGLSVEAFALAPAGTTSGSLARFGVINIVVDISGNLTVIVSGFVLSTTFTVANGATHHIAATWDGVTLKAYGDGAEVGSLAVAGALATTSEAWAGGSIIYANPPNGAVLSHVAVYTKVLSPTSITNHAASGVTGFGDEPTSARLARYASWALIPSGEVSVSGTSRSARFGDSTGASIVDLMRQLEATEQGVLHDARDGTLTLFGGTPRYTTTTPAFTLDMTAQKVGADYSPTYENNGILNDVTVTQAGEGGASARVVYTGSRADYGVGSESVEIVSSDDDDALSLASWLCYAYSEPQGRIPNVTVSVAESVGLTPSPDMLLAATIGTLIRLSNRPTQDDATTADLFVEGYTETITPMAHELSFNVSLASPENTVFILGDTSGRGVLGTNPLAY